MIGTEPLSGAVSSSLVGCRLNTVSNHGRAEMSLCTHSSASGEVPSVASTFSISVRPSGWS